MSKHRLIRGLTAGLALGLAATAFAAPPDSTDNTPAPEKRRPRGAPAVFKLDVPARDYDLLLVRPEDHAMTLSVRATRDLEAFVTYGPESGALSERTPAKNLRVGEPAEFPLTGLSADTAYRYRFHWRPAEAKEFAETPEATFRTARVPGGEFIFTLTADAHLDASTSPEVYLRTLSNIRADRPDFHLDLGNLFMTDKHAERAEATAQYAAQRYYLGRIGDTVPVLLVQGTHDGESARYDDGTADCLAVWSNLIRRSHFPNPEPDSFYSGNTTALPHRGLPQNYYAWTWGDALFVVLDAYGYTRRQRGGDDGWAWTLGREQYDWLARSLERSDARHKFVFIHNLLAGDQASRGGVELAPFNEWGGKNPDGTEGFADRRPGWAEPIHALLKRHGVTAVFRAHDNFYARQELDGIPYIMVPQPSFAGSDRVRDLENYGYKQGVFLGNSGHVRVAVSPTKVTVDYVRSTPGGAPVADTLTITPAR